MMQLKAQQPNNLPQHKNTIKKWENQNESTKRTEMVDLQSVKRWNKSLLMKMPDCTFANGDTNTNEENISGDSTNGNWSERANM